MLKKLKRYIMAIILAAMTMVFFSCQEDSNEGTNEAFFLFIPSEEGLFNYTNLRNYLLAWEQNEVGLIDIEFSDLMNNFIGNDSMESLLFESFLRYTKNSGIRDRVLTYFDRNRINTDFANSLRMLYASETTFIIPESGAPSIQNNYNNLMFDENINLFHFEEVSIFNDELGMLLFENDWEIVPVIDPEENEDYEAFYLMFGGGTNALTISFTRYSNMDESDMESIYNQDYYRDLYQGEWIITELPLVGVFSNAGADRIVIAHGHGPDLFTSAIYTGTFNAYYYNREGRILYEVSFYMNFSPVNIHYSERMRIYNHLYFQLMLIFIRQD